MLTVSKMTEEQRKFVLAVLKADAVPHYGKIEDITAIIAASASDSGGFVRVPLEKRDRRALGHRFTFYHLQLIGVKGLKFPITLPEQAPTLFPEFEMSSVDRELALPPPAYVVCRLQDRPLDGMVFNGFRTTMIPGNVGRLFWEPQPPWERIRAALVGSRDPDIMNWERNQATSNAIYSAGYVDAVDTFRTANDLDIIRRAIAALVAADLCTTTVTEDRSVAQGPKKVSINWAYLAHEEDEGRLRRPSLTSEEEDELLTLRDNGESSALMSKLN